MARYPEVTCSPICDHEYVATTTTTLTPATCASLLRQCGSSGALSSGKRLHAQMIQTGLDKDKYLGQLLVQMYANCRSIDDARAAFEKLSTKDVFSWSLILSAYAKNGYYELAVETFERMQDQGVEPDMFVYASVLRALCALGELDKGRLIHARLLNSQLRPDVVVINALVNLYAKCGCIDEARSLFDGMPARSLVSWNAMIGGYAQLNCFSEAYLLFTLVELEGLHPDLLTFINLLGACSSPERLPTGRNIHSRVKDLGLDANLVLATALLKMYAKCGSVGDSWKVFAGMKRRNEVSWNAMIAAFVELGSFSEAMHLFHQMDLEGLKTNAFTSATILGACTCFHLGAQLHERVTDSGLEGDPVVKTALLNMYSRLGFMDRAREIFETITWKDAIAWNAMLAGYAQGGYVHEALELFTEMQAREVRQDPGTFLAAAAACSVSRELLEDGRRVHARAIEVGCDSGVVLLNGFLSMYAKCGSLEEARACFDGMERRSVVSWNLLMNAYVEQEQGEEALKLLRYMDCQGVRLNCFTFSCIAQACSLVKELEFGKSVHARVQAGGFDTDEVVVTALVDMYGKCGNLQLARETFDGTCSTSVVSWNTMIGIYSQHGLHHLALEIFHEMSLAGEKPNESTFTLLLNGFTHAGVLRDAFDVMACAVEHGIACTREHYVCVVDLLGRAGKVGLAKDVIDSMPLEPDVSAWRCLLGACAVHGDVSRGSQAASQVADLQPRSAAPYILLSNITKQDENG